jgi:hypothetical protein
VARVILITSNTRGSQNIMPITPEWLDKWRIWPRMIITLYGVAFYQTTTWFMALDTPTNAQSAFVSVIVGAGAGFFGIYTNSKSSVNVPPAKKEACENAENRHDYSSLHCDTRGVVGEQISGR